MGSQYWIKDKIKVGRDAAIRGVLHLGRNGQEVGTHHALSLAGSCLKKHELGLNTATDPRDPITDAVSQLHSLQLDSKLFFEGRFMVNIGWQWGVMGDV